MKISTIILIGMMTLALKVIAMFTLGMGTLILESVILIYGWMSAYLALVTGVFIILSNIKNLHHFIHFMTEKEATNCFSVKKLILTSKRHVEHSFAGQNTQHPARNP